MSQDKGKLALIINSASYERVSFALGVAMTAAAVGREVRILFGYGAVMRLKKGFTDQIGEETAPWLREQFKAGVDSASVSPISVSLDTIRRFGGKIYACPTAMDVHNITFDELVPEVDEVRSVVGFVTEDAEGASILYV